VKEQSHYLQPFITPEIAQVFCAAGNARLRRLDRGKIVCVAIPQKFQMERRYIKHFSKNAFLYPRLRRFDKPLRTSNATTLLILWADESQRFVTQRRRDDDYNCIDVIREARATLSMPPNHRLPSFRVGRESPCLTLNLRNRLISSADKKARLRAPIFWQ